MVEPVYGYKITDEQDHKRVRYDRATGGSGEILLYPDRVSVDGQSYLKRHITRIYAKIPDFIAREAGHNPRPPKGIFAAIGFAAGSAVKKAQMDKANNEEWSVWLNYGEKPCRLAWGFNKIRAETLEAELTRLILYR